MARFVINNMVCIFFQRSGENYPKSKKYFSFSCGRKSFICKKLQHSENFSDETTKEFSKISIFMNVFNVHVNRIPVAGKVVWLKYIPGTFLNASLDKASENNERMIVKIEISKDIYIYVVQIAGLIARRIKCDLTENQSVNIGERFGIIRFGSRVDIYFPKDFKIKVLEGQTSLAGETILAEYK